MKREYAPRAFLRHIPMSLLRDYFGTRRLLDELAWDSLPEDDTETVYLAWEQLRDEDRERVEADFRLVHELATEEGVRILIEEAAIRGCDLAAPLNEWEGLHAKAFWARLHQPDVFQAAGLFQHTDHLSPRFWNKRSGFPRKPLDVSAEAVQRLREALRVTPNGHRERSNPPNPSPRRSSQPGAWGRGEGLAQKPTPSGKPGDTLTGPRVSRG